MRHPERQCSPAYGMRSTVGRLAIKVVVQLLFQLLGTVCVQHEHTWARVGITHHTEPCLEDAVFRLGALLASDRIVLWQGGKVPHESWALPCSVALPIVRKDSVEVEAFAVWLVAAAFLRVERALPLIREDRHLPQQRSSVVCS